MLHILDIVNTLKDSVEFNKFRVYFDSVLEKMIFLLLDCNESEIYNIEIVAIASMCMHHVTTITDTLCVVLIVCVT